MHSTDRKATLKWLIVLFFVFIFGFLPPVGQMTPIGMRILGIFIGAIYGWTVLGILQTTLIAIIGFGLTVGFSTYVAGSFGISMIAMMLIFFPICGMLNKYKVMEVLAQKFITTQFCEGHPWRICFMILFSAYICANINVLVAAVLFIAFIRNICKIADIPTPSKWSVAILIGVALALMCGQLMIPVFGTPLVLIGALTAITGTSVNLAKYIILIVPLALLLLLTYVLAMRWVLKIDVAPLERVTIASLGGKKNFNTDQKKALLILLLTLAAMVCSGVFPAESTVYQVLNVRLGLFGISICAVGVLLFIKNAQGEPLFDFVECARLGMAWEPLFLAAFIVPFSSYMTGGDTGISATLALLMQPLFGLPPLAFLIIMYLCVNIITNFAQNTVVVIIFLPLFMTYGQATGYAMEGAYILLFLLAQMALATPGSSTPCGIVYSATDLVDVKLVLQMALKVLPVLFIVLMLAGLPWSFILF